MPGQVSLVGSGNHLVQIGSGHDTIAIYGYGTDTIDAAHGKATVFGAFGGATISGGTLTVKTGFFGLGETASGGVGSSATLAGGIGFDTLQGGAAHDTLIAGLGSDTLIGGSGHDVFAVENSGLFSFGTDVIRNFVSGQDQLYLEGKSLSYLQQHHDIHTVGQNTFIQLGGTTVELEGIKAQSLKSTDISTHKP